MSGNVINAISSGDRHNSNRDRHLDNKDRHKVKSNRHKTKDDGHTCICGYAKCSELHKAFANTGHPFDRPLIQLKKSDDPLWKPFQESLFRNLHVHDDTKKKIESAQINYKFSVAALHFTTDVVTQYWSNTSIRKVWGKRLDKGQAEAVLHIPLDHRDMDEGKYFINANNPIVGAAEELLTTIKNKSNRRDRAMNRASSSSSGDAEKDALRISVRNKNKELSSISSELASVSIKLKEAQSLIDALKKQNQVLQQKAKRRGNSIETAKMTIEQLKDKVDDTYTINDVHKILLDIGGMSRATLFNESFHKKFPHAAKCLWGFESYHETLVMVECLFEDVDVNNIPTLHRTKKRKLSSSDNNVALALPRNMTPLEKCLICKMFFRNDLSQEFIGLIFGKHRTTIGSVLKEWAPRWMGESW